MTVLPRGAVRIEKHFQAQRMIAVTACEAGASGSWPAAAGPDSRTAARESRARKRQALVLAAAAQDRSDSQAAAGGQGTAEESAAPEAAPPPREHAGAEDGVSCSPNISLNAETHCDPLCLHANPWSSLRARRDISPQRAALDDLHVMLSTCFGALLASVEPVISYCQFIKIIICCLLKHPVLGG